MKNDAQHNMSEDRDEQRPSNSSQFDAFKTQLGHKPMPRAEVTDDQRAEAKARAKRRAALSAAGTAISIQDVSKVYNLYGSQSDQLVDVLKLQRFGFKTRSKVKKFPALKTMNLEVKRGQRIGILGRNGAGKTTLLKMICGNVTPTTGTVEVSGLVQALLSMGMGFHPDYTGRENVESSLKYNGLNAKEYEAAIEGVIEFCELGDFFDQPFKTYSAGMQARLMFAAATAVNPDILIVDEVLGAGDAYFIAKSKRRVESLISGGCTMLLVSHSMAQILELCDTAIWMEKGGIRMQGDCFEVVKAYEEYLHGPIQQVLVPEVSEENETEVEEADLDEEDAAQLADASVSRPDLNALQERLQEPLFMPHAAYPQIPHVPAPREHKFVARGGLSRWDGASGIKILGSTFVTERGETNELVSMRPVKLVYTLIAETPGAYNCRMAVCIFDHMGQIVLDVVSGEQAFDMKKGGLQRVEMLLNPLQLGPGEFTVSISVHDYEEIERFNSTKRYDLLSRSLEFRVELPESLRVIQSGFYHSAEWTTSATR